MSKVEAVVFDADGTLFNSFELINEAYGFVAKEFGYEPPTPEQVREQMRVATPVHEMHQLFFPDCDVNGMLQANREFFTENSLRVAAFEGLHELLDDLKSQDLKLAIFTGGTKSIHDWLKVHNVGHYFSSVVHFERTKRHKPHPEGYELAMKECGTLSVRSAIIGDSLNDVITGKKVGATTIGITHGLGTVEDLLQAGADFIVNTLTEVPSVIHSINQSKA